MIGLERWEINLIKRAYRFGFENGQSTGLDILNFPPDSKDFKALQRDFSKYHFGGADDILKSVKPALEAGLILGATSQITLSKLIK